MSLSELANNARTDKNTIHSYLPVYDTLFRGKKETATNVFEIGIFMGGSVKLWHDYFVNANIYSVDIIPIKDVWEEIRNKERIKLGRFDAYDESFVNTHLSNIKFDIILDDGPHTLLSMRKFIKLYLPLLKDNGILVIEDVQAIEWIETLKNDVPDGLKEYIEVYDLREKKNRYDDIVFVVNKSK
jgi:hypothetical protein